LKEELLEIIQKQLEISEIQAIEAVRGGDINEAFRLSTPNKNYFIKRNSASQFPNMFEAEAKGLQLLSETKALRVPKTLAQFDFEDDSLLVLEFLDFANPNRDFWPKLAEGLAALHKRTNEYFGLDHHNYIGNLQQSNRQHQSWADFFVTERLEPMLKMGLDQGEIHKFDLGLFDRCFSLLDDFFPPEKPSLIHGDFWSGNFAMSTKEEACAFDPAVYFGHREMDIAMSKLFGGFDPEFYKSYEHFYPLEQAWEERVDMANLYPLLVHVNLFGGSYFAQVKQILKSYD